jgi:hypothetical protein
MGLERGDIGQRVQSFSYTERIGSGLLYSIVTTVNNRKYSKYLTEWILNVLATKK